MAGRTKVGYMGIPFSNSEEMTQIFVDEMKLGDVEYVALMSSANVVKALFDREIDYGVVAVRNSSAGTVTETAKALEGKDVRILKEEGLRIHHCVFTKVPDSQITKVSSHIQAIGQCRNSLARLYPDAELMECSDTAYAAEMLASGELPDDCAVLCKRVAGEHYGLHLAHENIEDRSDNVTYFSLISL